MSVRDLYHEFFGDEPDDPNGAYIEVDGGYMAPVPRGLTWDDEDRANQH